MPSTHGPPAGSPAIPHDALVKQQQGQAVLIWAAGAFCVFGWEWLICLPQEYRRIWKKPITAPTALYIANRYFGLIQFCFVMTLVTNAWSAAACKHVFYWEPVGALISTVLSQLILGTRVYAIYAQNRVIGFVLAAILIVEIVIGGIAISTTSPPPQVPGPPGSGPPCGATMGPRGWLLAFWSIPLFYDAVAFLLTAWKAFDFWRREVNTPLFTVIWRDGVLYFFAIFSMNLANVVIFLTVPPGLRAINLTPTLMLEVILSCRLLLNLRGTHEENTSSAGRWRPNGPTSSENSKTRSNTSGRGLLQDNVNSQTPHSGTMELSSLSVGSQAKSGPMRMYQDSVIDVKAWPA